MTHAGFLGWLTGETVEFGNAEWRSYGFHDGEGEREEGDEAVLRRVWVDGSGDGDGEGQGAVGKIQM